MALYRRFCFSEQTEFYLLCNAETLCFNGNDVYRGLAYFILALFRFGMKIHINFLYNLIFGSPFALIIKVKLITRLKEN